VPKPEQYPPQPQEQHAEQQERYPATTPRKKPTREEIVEPPAALTFRLSAIDNRVRPQGLSFGSTNLGALVSEAGLRPAAAQLDNRLRRYGLRLLSLPQGCQTREVLGGASGLGDSLRLALAHIGRTEEVVLRRSLEALEAITVIEDSGSAKAAAERPRPGLTIFTDGSRSDNGAVGYAVTWKKGHPWVGVKAHMAFNQEVFDAECAALFRALEVAVRQRTTPERVMVFTDAQMAIQRITSEEPGAGQKYAIQARKWITALRRMNPKVTVEIRWCPAHQGFAGNEKADEWAKLAAE
jgi:ribonuclease HI